MMAVINNKNKSEIIIAKVVVVALKNYYKKGKVKMKNNEKRN